MCEASYPFIVFLLWILTWGAHRVLTMIRRSPGSKAEKCKWFRGYFVFTSFQGTFLWKYISCFFCFWKKASSVHFSFCYIWKIASHTCISPRLVQTFLGVNNSLAPPPTGIHSYQRLAVWSGRSTFLPRRRISFTPWPPAAQQPVPVGLTPRWFHLRLWPIQPRSASSTPPSPHLSRRPFAPVIAPSQRSQDTPWNCFSLNWEIWAYSKFIFPLWVFFLLILFHPFF